MGWQTVCTGEVRAEEQCQAGKLASRGPVGVNPDNCNRTEVDSVELWAVARLEESHKLAGGCFVRGARDAVVVE